VPAYSARGVFRRNTSRAARRRRRQWKNRFGQRFERYYYFACLSQLSLMEDAVYTGMRRWNRGPCRNSRAQEMDRSPPSIGDDGLHRAP
jgi:hypothetical protein